MNQALVARAGTPGRFLAVISPGSRLTSGGRWRPYARPDRARDLPQWLHGFPS